MEMAALRLVAPSTRATGSITFFCVSHVSLQFMLLTLAIKALVFQCDL